MVLVIFAFVLILESIFWVKYAKRTFRKLGKECIPDYIITDEDLEKIRKKLNSKFSKC